MNLCRPIFLGIVCGLFFLPQMLPARDNSARSLQDAYADVAEKVFPAVVVIEKYKYNGRTFVRLGTGSGFIVRPNGYIATNYHVIKNGDAIAVKLADKQIVPAKVIGTDPKVDLAVVKISTPRKLSCLKFTDTAKVKVGHYAIAVGAPFSLAHTMTTGIVSHKGRKLSGNYYEDYIQTDASINPGNSGGPLLDINGRVIGVNSCIISPGAGGSVGLGFAIDGNLAKQRIDTMIRSDSGEQPCAGMGIRDTVPPGRGARISRLVKRAPADKAGLQVNDIIVKIGSRPVANIYDAQSVILNYHHRGDRAEIVFIRGGKTMKTTIRFE